VCVCVTVNWSLFPIILLDTYESEVILMLNMSSLSISFRELSEATFIT
jgi:hypothetical protein